MDGVAACAGAPVATDARMIKKAITVFLMSAKLMIFPNSAIKTKENPKCNACLQIIYCKVKEYGVFLPSELIIYSQVTQRVVFVSLE